MGGGIKGHLPKPFSLRAPLCDGVECYTLHNILFLRDLKPHPGLCPCPWFGRRSPVPRTQLMGTEVSKLDHLQSWSWDLWVTWHCPQEVVCRHSTTVSSLNIKHTGQSLVRKTWKSFWGNQSSEKGIGWTFSPEAEVKDVTEKDRHRRQFYFCLRTFWFPRDLPVLPADSVLWHLPASL